MSNYFDNEQRRQEQIKVAKEEYTLLEVQLKEAKAVRDKLAQEVAMGNTDIFLANKLRKAGIEVYQKMGKLKQAEKDILSASVLSEEVEAIVKGMNI